MFNIALTGHTNIEKCYNENLINNGEEYNIVAYNKAYFEIESYLFKIIKEKNLRLDEVCLISGMSRGADEIFADIAYNNNMNLILSIPHSINWHKNRVLRNIKDVQIRAQAINYDKFLKYDKVQIFEIKKDYGKGNHMYANFARNQHMVDICDLLISFKKYNSVGTDHCIKSGKLQNKYYGNVEKEVQMIFDFNNDLK